ATSAPRSARHPSLAANGRTQGISRQTTMRLFRSRSWQRYGLPGWRALLPAVVGQRPLIRSVDLHDDQLAVRLWDIRHWRFVLETEARSAEQHMVSIGRTGRVRIVVGSLGQLRQRGSIGVYGKN